MTTLTSFKIFNFVNVNFLKWSGGFLGLILIQISVLKHLAISQLPLGIFRPNTLVQPDLILILLFFFGIRYSQLASTLTGFTAGFFLDALSGGILGLHALTKTVAGFLIGYVPRVHKIQTLVQFCVFYFAVGIVHDILYYVIYTINTEFSLWRLFFVHSFPSTLYSVFIGGMVYYWLKR